MIQSITRGAIRRSIGLNLGVCQLCVVTTAGTSAQLIDAIRLQGGDDEHNEKQVRIYDAAGSGTIVSGEDSVVSDYAGSTHLATMSPVFSAATTVGDKFEMWKTPWLIEDIDDAINQAISEVTGRCLQIKEIHSPFTESSKYLYDVLSDFKALSRVEYVSSIGTEHLLSDCETAFTGGVGTTATADSAFKKKGTYSGKFVVVGVGATTILCYQAISSVDISDCNTIEFWMYSSIALTAGQLQIKLDDTAAIASALEAIDIPAMDAGVWYRHSLSLANPHLDTAIISLGIYQVANVADFTFYLDDIKAVNSLSNVYKPLVDEYWDIAKGSTPYLQITSSGLSVIGTDTQLRLTGYQIPVLLNADATTSEVDPGWLVNKVTGELLLNHAKSSYLDIHDRARLGTIRLAKAEQQLSSITTNLMSGTRSVA